jgi:hypothetical protein
MASQKTPDEFLEMVDFYIQAKIKKAEEAASHFTSQHDVSIELKKSYTSFIIPCLIGARNDIKEVLKEPEVNNHNAEGAFSLLIYCIYKRSIKAETLKENCTDPIILAGLNLIQGVCADLMQEIKELLNYYNIRE